jgi:hypothetical protein
VSVEQHRVVVTGVGLVTPVGIGREETWQALLGFENGIRPVTLVESSDLESQIAGEVPGFDPLNFIDRKEARRMDRFVHFAVAASGEALRQSGLDIAADADAIGVMIGSGIGGLATLEEQFKVLFEKGPGRVSPLLVPMFISDMAAGQVSIQFGARGPNYNTVSACASGADAIGTAFEVVRRGDAVAMITGGSEASITRMGIAAFAASRALCTNRNDDPDGASRPFDAERSGFVPLPALLDQVLSLTGYAKYLQDGGDMAEERLENVLELRSVVSEYEEVAGEDGDLATFLRDVALVADVDELKEGSSAVTLITLHAAKGLEFPVVFLIGLEEGVLPHFRSFDDPGQMEEERRLCYVGITRAMDLLYLTRSYRRFSFGSHSANPPSRFLADIPAHLKRPFGSTPRSYVEAATAEPPFAPGSPPTAAAEWNTGDRVVHPRFGTGTVISSHANGGDVEVVVAFEAAGVRRLLQSYAKLVPA